LHTDVKIQYIAASLYHGIRGDTHDLSLFGTDHFARAFAADPDMVQQYLDAGMKLGVVCPEVEECLLDKIRIYRSKKKPGMDI